MDVCCWYVGTSEITTSPGSTRAWYARRVRADGAVRDEHVVRRGGCVERGDRTPQPLGALDRAVAQAHRRELLQRARPRPGRRSPAAPPRSPSPRRSRPGCTGSWSPSGSSRSRRRSRGFAWAHDASAGDGRSCPAHPAPPAATALGPALLPEPPRCRLHALCALQTASPPRRRHAPSPAITMPTRPRSPDAAARDHHVHTGCALASVVSANGHAVCIRCHGAAREPDCAQGDVHVVDTGRVGIDSAPGVCIRGARHRRRAEPRSRAGDRAPGGRSRGRAGPEPQPNDHHQGSCPPGPRLRTVPPPPPRGCAGGEQPWPRPVPCTSRPPSTTRAGSGSWWTSPVAPPTRSSGMP